MKLNKLSVFLTALLALTFLVSCNEDDSIKSPDNNVSFAGNIVRFGFLQGQQNVSKTFEVYTSNVVGTDRVFNIVVDLAKSTASPSSYTVPATVTVPANSNKGEFVVTASNTNLSTGAKDIVLTIPVEAGLSVGKAMTIRLHEICAEGTTTVNLDLLLDRYGSETTWELYNADTQDLLYSGGPYTDLTAAGTQAKSIDWCLTAGNYLFVIYDAYNDGIDSGAGEGTYNINILGEFETTRLVTGTGEFTDQHVSTFTIE